jgi:hypothetical protein
MEASNVKETIGSNKHTKWFLPPAKLSEGSSGLSGSAKQTK